MRTFKDKIFTGLTTLIFLVILLGSCRTTRYVTFNAQRPAAITFDPAIKNFTLVDRTEMENKNINVIEGVITGERPGDDKRGVQTMILSLKDQLNQTDRFDVAIAEDRLKGNHVLGEFPEPTPWTTVIRIANETEADLVILVEVYDSDFSVSESSKDIVRDIAEGGIQRAIKKIEFTTRGTGNLRVGFRIYDPLNENIIDQEIFTVTHHWESKGPTPILARKDLIHRGDAMRRLSEMAASRYAAKLSPTYIRLRREFFSRKRRAPELAIGSRYADVNDWEKSLETWKNGLDKATKRKIAGRYCHNIAVAYEVLGDLDAAIEWSNRAWVEYEIKESRYYNQSLRYRKQDEAILEDQLN